MQKKHLRQNALIWRFGLNLRATLRYFRWAPRTEGEAARVVSELRRNGIGITTVDALLPSRAEFGELSQAVDQLERDSAADIAEARSSADAADSVSDKNFIYMYLGETPKLTVDSVFARFALQEPILKIANAYFRMTTELRDYNIWRTFRTVGSPRTSQLWHRDREDQRILKVFVYLSDVTEGAGPLSYAPGTHSLGAIKRLPEAFNEEGVQRSTDEQMAVVVPKRDWIVATGLRGTIVFADTRGYHKGGLARKCDRLFYICMFTSPSSQTKENFDRSALTFPDDRVRAAALLLRGGRHVS